MKKIISIIMALVTVISIAMLSGCDLFDDIDYTTMGDIDSGFTVSTSGTTTTTTTTTATTTTCKDSITTTTTRSDTTGNPYNPVPDPSDTDTWDRVINDIYTAENGGFQLYVPGWKEFGLYSVTMVPSDYTGETTTNAISVIVYPKGTPYYDEDSFENLTSETFEEILQASLDSLDKTTIHGYTCYKAVVEDMYYFWLFQTDDAKYVINFMQSPDYPVKIADIADEIMSTIKIYK